MHTVQTSHTADNYGVSFTYGALEDGASIIATQDNMGVVTFYALNATHLMLMDFLQ